MIRRLFSMTLYKRFFTAVREEGLGSALTKARIYTGIVLRNRGRSSLFGSRHAHVSRDHLYLNNIWSDLAKANGFHVSAAPALLSKRRKIALIADLNLPQCRKYRVEQLAAFWGARDVEVVYSHYADVPRSVMAMQDATHLIEYRLQALPVMSMYRYEARRLRLPVLYDIDDPLFSIAAYETYGNMAVLEPKLKTHFLSEAPKYLDMMNGADLISVSTPGMVAHTKYLTPRPVYLRRNFADASTLAEGARQISARPAPDGVFRLAVASGSRGHEVDFAGIIDPVAAFLDAAPNRRLMVLGHFDATRLPKAISSRIEAHPFTSYGDYLGHLAQANCAVMPLADDLFNRCKSAVRVIDAAAVSVPSITGTVGDLAQMIQPGQTGFVAEQPADWTNALEHLARDPAAAAEMGRRARAELELNWSGSDASHIISPELLQWVKA